MTHLGRKTVRGLGTFASSDWLRLGDTFPDIVRQTMFWKFFFEVPGCCSVGERNGGEVRDLKFLPYNFLPALKKAGISEVVIKKLTVENPANAFSIGSFGRSSWCKRQKLQFASPGNV